jgi:hypothetical protein
MRATRSHEQRLVQRSHTALLKGLLIRLAVAASVVMVIFIARALVNDADQRANDATKQAADAARQAAKERATAGLRDAHNAAAAGQVETALAFLARSLRQDPDSLSARSWAFSYLASGLLVPPLHLTHDDVYIATSSSDGTHLGTVASDGTVKILSD